MKPSTLSLFEQEISEQVAAARVAVADAADRADPLLLQAAENHLDALVALARRNGVILDGDTVQAGAATAQPLVAPPA